MTEREDHPQPEERPQERPQPPAPEQESRQDESIKEARDTVQPEPGMQGPPDGNPPPPPPPDDD